MKRKQSDSRHTPQHEKKEKMKFAGYVGDPRLTSRVRQYLEANRKKAAVSVSTIAEDLQAKYGEYSRKKKDAFRKCVEKAYQAVCKTTQDGSRNDEYSAAETAYLQKRHKQGVSGGTASDDSSSDSESSESFSSENPDYVVYQETNTMNSFMTNLYKGDSKKSLPGSASADNSRHCSPLRTLSTPASPCGKNTGEEIADCFIIDRTGDRKTPAKDKQQKSRTPKPSKAQNVIRKEVLSSEESAQIKPQEKDTGWIQTDKLTDISSKDSVDKEVNSTRKRLKTAEEEEVEGREEGKATSREDQGKSVNKNEKPAKKKVKVKGRDEEPKKKGPVIQQSQVTFADIGGNDSTLRDVCKLLVHMKHPEVYQQLGVTPPRGFLLHGPPGCGKTLLANAIAGELELPFIKMAATEIVSGVSGESEEKVRDVFEKAKASAPCVVFLDEIDAITQKRETASKDMERRIVSQLLTCMDDLNSSSGSHVLVIGATNRPDSLDPALRRAGRFDREISLGIPDENARERILQVLCRGLKLEVGFDFRQLAKDTPGFVGADLTSLAREAAITAVSRVFKELQTGSVNKKQSGATSNVMETSEPVPEEEGLPQSLGVSEGQNVETVMDCESGNVDNKCDDTETEPGGIKVVPDLRVEEANTTKDAASETVLLNEASGQQQEVPLTVQKSLQDTDPLGAAPSAAAASSQEEDVTEHAETGQKQSADTAEFQTVLSWLKDRPPLSQEQLQDLWITRTDFEAALKVVQPSAKREGFATIPDVTWADIGALKNVREELQLAILAPVRHPEQFKALGLTNPPGILLAGPPGCGKTLLAKAVANESGINFISVKGPELLNMYVGESERAVRQVFQRARNSSPCVIFFDELDALCPRRSDAGEGGASVRVVNQLLTEMDGLEERKQVFIMAATNRPDIIDPAILRPGRLDKILYVGLPQSEERWDILKTITKNGTKPKLAEDVDLLAIASCEDCEGYTGADLAAVVREASVAALKEFMMTSVTLVPGTSVLVNNQHFLTSLQKVKPSVSEKDQIIYKKMREGIRR